MENLLDQFKKLIVDYGNLQESLEFEKSNKVHEEITKVYNKIIKNPEGVKSITSCMDDDNPWIRLWSAAFTKDIYPEKAKKVFTELSLRDDLISSDAELHLYLLEENK